MFGMIISLPMSGFLAHEFSWKTVFYVCGAIGVIWFAFFCFLCHSSPTEHPRISEVT